jgi:hypothetical protein
MVLNYTAMDYTNLEVLEELKGKVAAKSGFNEYYVALDDMINHIKRDVYLLSVSNDGLVDRILKTERTLQDVYLVRDSILRNHGYKSYDEFLRSEYWKSVREKVKTGKYKEKYCKCNICDSEENIHLHHNTYRWMLTKYELREIISLCRDCHLRLHQISTEQECTLNKALGYIRQKINEL